MPLDPNVDPDPPPADVYPDPPDVITAPYEVFAEASEYSIRDARTLRVLDLYECIEMMNELYRRDNHEIDATGAVV